MGGLLAAIGVTVAAIDPYCGSSLHVQVGAIALLFDIGAVLSRRAATAIPLSLLKLTAVLAGLFLVVSCAPPPVDWAPVFPNGTAFGLLLGSAVPSVLGAMLLRWAR